MMKEQFQIRKCLSPFFGLEVLMASLSQNQDAQRKKKVLDLCGTREVVITTHRPFAL